jgi:hypothetical protein
MAHRVGKAADEVLLQALAWGATVENAARKAGISERTAYRRLNDPSFVQRLEQLRADMVQRTAGMLSGAGMGSVKVLVDLQNDVSVPAGVRRRSARDVLELGLRFRETTAWERRLDALDEHLVEALAVRLAQAPAPSPDLQATTSRPPTQPSSSCPRGENHDEAADSTPGSPPRPLDT